MCCLLNSEQLVEWRVSKQVRTQAMGFLSQACTKSLQYMQCASKLACDATTQALAACKLVALTPNPSYALPPPVCIMTSLITSTCAHRCGLGLLRILLHWFFSSSRSHTETASAVSHSGLHSPSGANANRQEASERPSED